MAEKEAREAKGIVALNELYCQRVIGIEPLIAVISLIAISESRPNFFNTIEMEEFLIREIFVGTGIS